MTFPEDYQELLNNKGIPLSDLHINDIAFGWEDALHAVDILRGAGVPILGGDAWVQTQNRIQPAYKNWSVERLVSESREVYLQRSWDAATRFLKSFPQGGANLFSLTTGEKVILP